MRERAFERRCTNDEANRVMKLNVGADLQYEFAEASELIVSIQAAFGPDQRVVSERLTLNPSCPIIQDGPDARGERRFRVAAHGALRMHYEAVVDNGQRQALTADMRQLNWTDLPEEVLQYLTPSRYCPSDKFVRFAQRDFGAIAVGGARVQAVLDWIHSHVDYEAGVSIAETTAERTFIDRAGVCRDFTHLAITLCRALNIPARAVSAYAWKLDPPDFHAVPEVFLEGGWRLLDPTRLAPIEGLVRIGVGRDAGDIAFLTSSGTGSPIAQNVCVSAYDDPDAL
jgi:transglutaminase-like putative cysteine protease